MNTAHLEKARKVWGFAMDFSLKDGRLYVANDGWISDQPEDAAKIGKYFGQYKGFSYYTKRKGTLNVIINVINVIAEGDEAQDAVVKRRKEKQKLIVTVFNRFYERVSLHFAIIAGSRETKNYSRVASTLDFNWGV
jgi:hypothetical protein